MAVVDGRDVGQRQRLADREEVELAVGDVVRPGRRAVVGIGPRRQRQCCLKGGLLRRRQRQHGDAVGRLVAVARERRGDDRPVAEVDVGKGDAAAGMVGGGIAGAGLLGEAVAAGRDRGRRVVGAGDGDRDRLGDDAAMAVVDLRRVGQRQDLADRQEIERAIGDAVGPGRRTVVGIA